MKDKETKEFGREGQDEQREKMVRIQFPKTIQKIEQEAERRGRIKQLKEDIEQVEIFLPKEVSDTDKYWIPTQIIIELEDDIKLLEEEK